MRFEPSNWNQLVTVMASPLEPTFRTMSSPTRVAERSAALMPGPKTMVLLPALAAEETVSWPSPRLKCRVAP
ncbi:hypothetical protein GO296_05014 [Ralstonia solanacearum]|nr:hypothetical protein [Ralstonia solanacearum]